MLTRELLSEVVEHVPDDVRVLRDSIAKEQTQRGSQEWDQYRELSQQLKELKDKCKTGASGHSLIIVLSGKPGTRRRLMRNSRPERRTCMLCGTEEVGKLTTGFLSRLLLRKSKWHFTELNGNVTRTFSDPEWYFEIASIARNFAFPTDAVFYHAFPPHLPHSLLDHEGRT